MTGNGESCILTKTALKTENIEWPILKKFVNGTIAGKGNGERVIPNVPKKCLTPIMLSIGLCEKGD